jgi:hypothetical protein
MPQNLIYGLTREDRMLLAEAARIGAAHHRRLAPDPARAEDLYRSHMSAARRLRELADKLEGWG